MIFKINNLCINIHLQITNLLKISTRYYFIFPSKTQNLQRKEKNGNTTRNRKRNWTLYYTSSTRQDLVFYIPGEAQIYKRKKS